MPARLRRLLLGCLTLTLIGALMLTQVRALQTPTLNPFEITATYIVGQATEAAMTQVFWTPTSAPPTLTPFSTHNYAALVSAYRQILPNAAGFDHPIFDEIAAQFIDELERFERDARGWPPVITASWLTPQISRVEFAGVEFVAMIVRDQLIEGANRLLMFRLDGDTITLLPPLQRSEPMGYILSFNRFALRWLLPRPEITTPGFEDRNQNQYPDIALYTITGGSSPLIVMLLLELQPDGSLRDITPPTNYGAFRIWELQWLPRGFLDLDEDGVLEIASWECVPHLWNLFCDFDSHIYPRYFAWRDETYVDVSADLDAEIYYPQINAFWRTYTEALACQIPTDNMYYAMYEMLIAAYIRGELEAHWARLQDMLRWDECPSTSNLDEITRSNMDIFLSWVEDLHALEIAPPANSES